MKICTACGAKYTDESLSFCQVDGTTLTPERQVSFEQQPFSHEAGSWSDEHSPAESESQNYYSSFGASSASANYTPSASASASSSSGNQSGKRSADSFLIPAIAVGAGFLVIIVGFLVITGGRAGNKDYPLVSANARVDPVPASNTAVVVNAAPRSTETPIVKGNSNSAANAVTTPSGNGKTLPKNLDLTGVWTGKFSDAKAVLSITTQKGETFSGTLSKNGYVVRLAGKINYEKGTINIEETEVLQTPGASSWSLGTDDGTISNDGKSMSGTGRDKSSSYSWSFSR